MKKVRLGDICTVVSGTTPKSHVDEYWNGDKVWITPAEINEDTLVVTDSVRHISESAVKDSSLKSFPKGTVILSSRAPIGKMAIAGCEMYCNQGFKNLICSEKINNLYLLYFLRSRKNYLNSLGRGATFKEISKGIVENIKVPLPSMDTQIQIGNRIRTIEKLIGLRKKQLFLLDDLIKSRFVEMFGDPGNYNRVKDNMTKLGNCCQINPPKNLDLLTHRNLKVSFIPMSAISENGNVDYSMTKFYAQVDKGFTNFIDNDVLFAKITPCMENGKGAVVTGLCNGIGFGSTEFHVLRAIPGLSNPYWIYVLTTFSIFRKAAAIHMTGSAGQRRTPASFLYNYQVVLPSFDRQNEFGRFFLKIDKSKLSKENRRKMIQNVIKYREK